MHLERLVDLSLSDRSPGVRLSCAAAAADILTRYRLDPGPVDAAMREALYARFQAADPGVNPGLFQVAAVLGTPAGFRRVELGLRDPRLDVRAGAVVGVWRHCVSAAVNGDAATEAAVVAWLSDTRIRVETRAELARVCANMGYATARTATERLVGAAGKGVAAVAGEALARLERAPERDGVWVDLGLDAGAVDPAASVRRRAATVGDQLVERVATRIDAPRRVLWIKRPGRTEPAAHQQIGRVTWWAADAEELVEYADGLVAARAWAAIGAVDPILPRDAAGLRVRGAALLAQGATDDALLALRAAIELKKVPPDTWWFLGDACWRSGAHAEAREHFEKFLAKVPKKAPYAAEARARLEETP